ncbi:GntR family transcriptional regulator [Conexibacter sp. JD483]|uniref:FadR/GntR family transcriptional regulator n=1 Tax=unclassified Conexibacter TaxID=2627773 RepID=UPI00272194DB|nr:MULTISPECIES: GntR family transcriptional regulator [unclassified Conexibacter]MDO8187644.1 GntR family transcriptional regulator [Conexibacter sp. CPCC 205706]MDO8199829.1 GntR family transcriptional regulator [Conexibacter sp. CPCC 205762]MDR9370206.1 GntR family transcriptional regulator [Conexibacter sp. JD483]
MSVVERTSLVDQAISALKAEIESGAWTVGSRIPTEPQLTAQFGIGRNALREAVRALVYAGMLEPRQGDGTYLRATNELAGALRRRIGDSQSREVQEVQRALEVEAARLAAARRSDAQAEELQRLLENASAAWQARDLERLAAADLAVSDAIVTASGNGTLIELYANVGAALPEGFQSDVVRAAAGQTSPPYGAVVAAIVAQDAHAAAAAVALRNRVGRSS